MNFYKILNDNEKHQGLQYKTGLNIDPHKFNPSGDCQPGGIYFASKDILAFLDYGPWIRKVTLPKNARIYENPGSPKKWKADKVVLGKRKRIDVKIIQELIEEGADPKAYKSYALIWAAGNGYFEIVKLLIKHGADPKARDSYALRWAARNGHLEIVKLLIPLSDPKSDNNYELQLAIENGYLELVKLLIPISDITKDMKDWIKVFCRDLEIKNLVLSYIKENEK